MRRTAIIAIVLLLLGAAFATSSDGHDFSRWATDRAIIPPGLTVQDARMYTAGYEEGYYAALHPAYYDGVYIINTKTKKFHNTDCLYTLNIGDESRLISTDPLETLLEKYSPCGECRPQR